MLRRVRNNIHHVLKLAIDYSISLYLLLLIGVLPFYFEREYGYGYIATNKAAFFCQVSLLFGKGFAIILIFYTISTIAMNYANIKFTLEKNGLRKILKGLICKISATDLFIGLYGVALVLSYCASNYQEQALWGAIGWYVGFVPQMILVCIYFVVAKLWRPKKALFYLIFPVSAAVFVLGYLNRFGFFPIEMKHVTPEYISTIGNINWYCGYAVTVFFVGVALFWQGGRKPCNRRETQQALKGVQGVALVQESDGTKRKKVINILSYILWGAYFVLGFGTLVTQGSLSGIVTLGVMMLLFFCLSVKDSMKMERFWQIVLLQSCACLATMILRIIMPEAITYQDSLMNVLTLSAFPFVATCVSVVVLLWLRGIRKKQSFNREMLRKTAVFCVTFVSCVFGAMILLIVINTINPGAIGVLSEYNLFTFSGTWGSNRGTTWRAGILCFGEQNWLHKLVGVGPDSMGAYISKDAGKVLTEIVRDRFGVNIILTNAHNEWLTVLVNTGILGLVGFGGSIVSTVRAFCGCRTSSQAAACVFGVIAYSIYNIFSFQQTMNVTLLFLFMAMYRAFLRVEGEV